ncbi:MAG: ketopantoate reductase family protein, partial [Nitrospinaceae bacterium]
AAAPAVWSKRTRFVLCQNGWGNAEIFARRLPPSQIYNARVITGFCRPRPYQVEITVHADTVRMGSLLGGEPQALEPIAAALDRGGFPCQVTDSIGRDLWAKMLYNCMLNGLSTLFGVPYGVLGESPHASDLMDRLAGEVFGVMQAAGHVTHWANVEDYLAVFYGTQLPATYQHEPSMLQDVRAGKRTEVEALNGEIVRLGETLARPVPINHAVRQMIRFLEERNSWA